MVNENDTSRQGKDLKRLLSFTKPHKKLFSVAFLLLIAATVAEMLSPIIVKIFIDDYLVPQNFEQNKLIMLVGIYFGVLCLKVIFSYFQVLVFQRIAFKIVQEIRVSVYERVQRLSLSFFDKTPIGSIVSRITNDTEAIKEFYVSVLATFLHHGVALIGILVAMFLLNAKLALFCLFIIPVIFLIMKEYRKRSSAYFHRSRTLLSTLNAKLNESIQGMAIIQVFRQEKRLRKEFEETNKSHFQANMRNIRLDALLLRPANDVVRVVALVFIIGSFGMDALNSPVEIGVLYAFISYLDRFFAPLNEIMMKLALFQQALVSSSRVFDLMDEENISPVKVGNEHPVISQGEIEFRNVTFSYDGKRDVLKDISFKVRAGETIAFVGHTGSGKSTIMNLLLRFYTPQSGQILLDGEPLETFDEKEIRQKLGLVLQDAFIFAGTVKHNISLHNESIPEDTIKKAAEFVQAHTFIEKLPDKYDTELVERGATLSSGQRQLLTFARTIAANPKVLVLDEATANIDTETEELIQEALEKMREGRTTIAIAHRLSTIQDADQIIVLHSGEVVEHGRHQELLQQKGLYYNMYLLQNKKALQQTV
ncbi:ABC transporter ATP-binding protein [Priestia taiwanensis]|uniref:ABC transporter ATP-binding protein n=1 Tax=Priestia taiwanensis TaxID=1347902 RepID=A0A917ANP5_9BACI|nr:ABC transporter transmembrane domain-containing protein [Priestia taiwanensis]MBM7362550.1 ATP-binding cassette subfamily B protein [Priestia taiwanensis]GGE63144.1 ABC transporter ATP-binding protein [Priestia taiwanensis]